MASLCFVDGHVDGSAVSDTEQSISGFLRIVIVLMTVIGSTCRLQSPVLSRQLFGSLLGVIQLIRQTTRIGAVRATSFIS